MRIACLQFAPQVGDVENNLNRADAVLSRANPQDIDLLVLPELAFSGYNFKSLQHISPYLEPTTSGITSLWARTTALKYDCVVTAGYPEKVDVSPKWPTSPEYYNSAITVNADGETVANYRKSFLYVTDETWALEGPNGFYDDDIEGLGRVAMGICMDINPYKFEAPWNAWEFAHHILHRQANLVVLSMAWRTRENARAFSRTPKEPDMDTLAYWLMRLEPLIRIEGEDEIIVVFANRTGNEDDATYAGTSAVLGIQSGEVHVYGVLGRGERELLMVDTSIRPKMKLVCQPARARVPQAATKLAVDTRLSASSDSTTDSDNSLASNASMATSHTSLASADAPPLTPCSFSPMDDPLERFPLEEVPYAQDDFPIKLVTDMPPPPPPPPAPSERFPTPTPVPSVYSRPSSPKSRNCSRSRGADVDMVDSPVLGRMLGNILTDEERLRESSILNGTVEDDRQSRADQYFNRDENDFLESAGATPIEPTPPRSPDDGNRVNIPPRVDSLPNEKALDMNEILFIQDFGHMHLQNPGSRRGTPVATRMLKSPSPAPQQVRNSPAPREGSTGISEAGEKFRVMHISEQLHYPQITPQLISNSPPVEKQARRSPPLRGLVEEDMENEIRLTRAEYSAELERDRPLHSPFEVAVAEAVAKATAEAQWDQPIQSILVDRSQHRTRAVSENNMSLPPIKMDEDPFESSFTKNVLGPRSRHVLPRPRSTIW